MSVGTIKKKKAAHAAFWRGEGPCLILIPPHREELHDTENYQPGMHDARWLLERCAESDTVLYSHIEGQNGEDWERYVRRLAAMVRETGARCILRPEVFPSDRDGCAAMQDLWHELTA